MKPDFSAFGRPQPLGVLPHEAEFEPGAHYAAALPHWALGLTIAGECECGPAEGPRRVSRRGDLGLCKFRAPQSWRVVGSENWRTIYCVFDPRPHWLPWLDWEEFGTGHAALRLENDAQIREVLGLFRQAIRLLNHGAPDATDLMYVTVENILLQCNRLRRRTMKHGDPRVEAAIQSVMANLDRPPSLPEMARHVHLSRTQFAHLFQKQTGMGFAAFCTRERMQRAAQLLRFSFQPIKSVAAELGFADPKYFSTSFRRTIGMSPQAYRSGAYGNNARQPVVIS